MSRDGTRGFISSAGGLDLATIRRFRLGYATERSDALKRALEKTFSEPLLIEAGVLRPRDGGGSYDYFRNRVIFPIGDRQGRIIAFGGRVLGEGQPKYLNSPETPLFHKGSVLYGWAAARAAAARAPSAIVTEGYMDVIALHRAGFETAVAPLGTALTEMQIEALWRLAPEPVLCFDGDAAGLRAAGRALQRALPMLKPGHSLKVATLPAGEDPKHAYPPSRPGSDGNGAGAGAAAGGGVVGGRDDAAGRYAGAPGRAEAAARCARPGDRRPYRAGRVSRLLPRAVFCGFRRPPGQRAGRATGRRTALAGMDARSSWPFPGGRRPPIRRFCFAARPRSCSRPTSIIPLFCMTLLTNWRNCSSRTPCLTSLRHEILKTSSP